MSASLVGEHRRGNREGEESSPSSFWPDLHYTDSSAQSVQYDDL